ncbi:hypothetical protein [Myxosarcina sp. GI1]|uniref:hypothetical protein n=1 Tax=Myxosarcina sp. GI1 TaxID=1541065 RepID=UPI00055A8D3C|nr:hypothetical protein [Myxosarcina sp. GI1]
MLLFIFKSKLNFWLGASIAAALLFSLSGLKLAFQPYTIQDDARQHVFWIQQFSDPDLFRQDLIADYFSSVAPWGYKVLYQIVNILGIKPFLFSKILPVIIAVITTVHLFLVCLEIFPVPFSGFIATLLLNQNLWMLDDLSSGTPRAFFYPLFVGFIYYLLRRSYLTYLFILLQGLFYPQVVLIAVVILAINFWRERSYRWFYFTGLLVAMVILGIYALQTLEYGDVISLATAKTLPEFYPDGRNEFFVNNPVAFWLYAPRSGFFPHEWQYVLLCSFGLCLPILKLFPQQFPLVTKINKNIKIVWQIFLAALIMFALAHLFLFKLHLPSRYSQHSLRILIALIDGIAIAVVLNAIFIRLTKHQRILKSVITIITFCILLYPTYAVQKYSYRLGYVTGNSSQLYRFLQQQPKDILIASLSEEANFIPSLAERSVLTAAEYSIPYHLDYYRQIRQRTEALITAQYTDNLEKIESFIDLYDIDLWLLDRDAFTVRYLQNNNWLMQFLLPAKRAIAFLRSDTQPILLTEFKECRVFEDDKSILLNAKCLKSKI